MKTNYFVITSMLPWDAQPTSDIHHLALALAKRARVLYVNPPSDMVSLIEGSGRREIDRRCRVLTGSEPMLRHVSRNLWVLEPPVLISQPSRIFSDKVFDILNRRNNKNLAEIISWAIAYLKFGEFTLLVDNDIVGSQHLDEFLDPKCLAYYRQHDIQALAHVSNSIKRLERSLITKSDVVFTTSRILAKQIEGFNYNTFDIGRGTNLDGFNTEHTYNIPSDILAIRRPIIGCQNVVLGEHTIAADLLYRVAKAYSDCSMVLVGGEDAYMASHKLHSLPNVYFLGSKEDAELPAYINIFDICICAQPDNHSTRINYPDNIIRYLALGKCVVANHSEPVRQFASKIHLALDDIEFIGLVGIGLYEGHSMIDVPTWANYAQRYVWETSADRMLNILEMVGLNETEETNHNIETHVDVYS